MTAGGLASISNTNALSLSKFCIDVFTDFVSSANLLLSEISDIGNSPFNGLIVAPKIAHWRQNPARTMLTPFQPLFSSKYLIKGAKTNAPTPEPHVAIPVKRF